MRNPSTLKAVEQAGARLLAGQAPRTYSERRRMRAISRELDIPVPVEPSRPGLRVFSPATADYIRHG